MNTLQATTDLFAALDTLDEAGVERALSAGANVRLPRNAGNGWSRSTIQTPLLALWTAVGQAANRQDAAVRACAIARRLMAVGGSALSTGITGQPLISEALFFLPTTASGPIVQALLESGANPNAKDALGVSPLMVASENGHAAAVEVLLAAGVDPSMQDRTGATALMRASSQGHDIIMARLLATRVGLDQGDDVGATALLQQVRALAQVDRGGEARLPTMRRVRALLTAGAQPNRADMNGSTPLMEACRLGSGDLVRVLLSAGADPNAMDADGQTPLMALAEVKARPDGPTHADLPRAIQDVARSLFLAGADPSLRNASGQTAEDLLRARAQTELTDAWSQAYAESLVKGLPRVGDEAFLPVPRPSAPARRLRAAALLPR